MNISLAIFYSVITSLLWGAGPVFFKKGYNKFSPEFTYIIDGLFGGTLILLPFALLGGVNWNAIFPALLITSLYSLSYFIYLKAYNLNKAALISSITQIYPVFTILLALTIGSETLSFFQFTLVLVLLIFTLMLATTEVNDIKKILSFNTLKEYWFVFSFATAVIVGVGDFFLNYSIDTHNIFTATLAIYLTQIFIGFIVTVGSSKKVLSEANYLINNLNLSKSLFLGSIFMTLGAITFYLAFENGPASLVSPIAATSPIFTITSAMVLLNEKINKRQGLLISTILLCVIILSI